GGIAVGTMPLLRSRELDDITSKAQIHLALCDGDLVTVERGLVSLSNPSTTTARLVWGENPRRPSYAPHEDHWTGF
ncbi:MAG: hypothetical protein AAFW98_14180, partial [Pseudomonadota bacterium]